MKKIFLYLLFTVFIIMMLGEKVEAAQINTVQAVLYTNNSTVIYAGADLTGTVVLPDVEEGLPVKVTGVTDNGFFQVDIAGIYYIPCSGLAVSVEESKSTPIKNLNMVDLSDTVIEAKYTYREYIKEIVQLVNEEREKVGLNPLEYDDDLSYAATRRSAENAYYDNFSHTRPNGTSCLTIFAEYNMYYHRAGENIAMRQKTPKEVMEDWMESPGHRMNILGKYTRIGIGVASDEKGQLYWTQLFYA